MVNKFSIINRIPTLASHHTLQFQKLDYRSCTDMCDEKTYIGYVIKGNDDLAYCTYDGYPGLNNAPVFFLHEKYPIHPSRSSWTNCDIQGWYFFGIFGYKYPSSASNAYYFDSTTRDSICLSNFGFTPTYTIDNIELLGNYVCKKPDNFDCKPTTIRRSEIIQDYIIRFPFVEGTTTGTYVDVSTTDEVYDFEGMPIGIGDIYTRNLYPYNYKLSCNYTISLEKDIYEVDINLISAAYFTYEDNIPGTVPNGRIAIQSDMSFSALSHCEALPSCREANAYKKAMTGFRTASMCRSIPNPGSVCFDATKTIEQNEECEIVDFAGGPSRNWLESQNCCVHKYNNSPIMDNFENYCNNKNYSKITSQLSCSEINEEQRSLKIVREGRVISSVSPFVGLADSADNHPFIITSFIFEFPASICVAKHKTNNIDVSVGSAGVQCGCNYLYPEEESIIISPTLVKRSIKVPKIITIEVYYCKKTYSEC